MTSTPRRVLAFIAAGLLLAVAIGMVVWRTSAPNSVAPEPSAATAETGSSTAQTSSSERSYTTTSSAPQQKTSQEQIAAPADDPYLAPNAVLDRTEPAQPTAVYRPDNVSSLGNQQPQDTAQPQTSNNPQAPQGSPDSSATASATSSPGAPTPGSTANGTPSTEPTAQPEPQTASPQGAQQNDRTEPGSTEPQVSTAPEHTHAPNAPANSQDTQPAGLAQEAPKPQEEPHTDVRFKEPTDQQEKAQDSQKVQEEIADKLAELEREREQDASRTNEAPKPAAPTDGAPAAEEPAAEQPEPAEPAANEPAADAPAAPSPEQPAGEGPSAQIASTDRDGARTASTAENSAEGEDKNKAPVKAEVPVAPELPSSPAELSGLSGRA